LLDASGVPWIRSIFRVKPQTFSELLRAFTGQARFVGADVHSEEGSAKVECDVVGMDENSTGLEHAQGSGKAEIIFVEADLGPVLLLGKLTECASQDIVVNLVNEEALLLIDDVPENDEIIRNLQSMARIPAHEREYD
jgi:hypothetical protein